MLKMTSFLKRKNVIVYCSEKVKSSEDYCDYKQLQVLIILIVQYFINSPYRERVTVT